MKKILIIDDEPLLLEVMAVRLRANRYEVAQAVSGEEGLAQAKKGRPDLILLDILMPDKDGYQVLRLLKEAEETKTIPVVMLTVRKWSRDIKKAMDNGAEDYVVKPFDPALLLKKIKGALND